MAAYFGIHQRTIQRRLREYDIAIGQTYSEISDDSLDSEMLQIITDFSIAVVTLRFFYSIKCQKHQNDWQI